MREPGRLVMRVTRGLGLTRLCDTVLRPAIADMQHEFDDARPGWERALILARGYVSLLAGATFYAALLPSRHVRENWSSLEAPGPRLLRQVLPVATVVTALCVALSATGLSSERGGLGPGLVALLFPSIVVAVLPLALATGVGWALARDRSSSPAAVAVGLLGAGLVFTVYDTVVPHSNQAYRLAALEATTGRSIPILRGSREMTLSELGAATPPEGEACPVRAGRCSGRRGESAERFRIEWHKRLSLPAFGLSLMALAAVLSRSGRRLVVVPTLWLTYGIMFIPLHLGEPYAVNGEVPVFFVAWGGHLVPLAIAAILHFAIRERPHEPQTLTA